VKLPEPDVNSTTVEPTSPIRYAIVATEALVSCHAVPSWVNSSSEPAAHEPARIAERSLNLHADAPWALTVSVGLAAQALAALTRTFSPLKYGPGSGVSVIASALAVPVSVA
jgi:hypothetical protein